MDECTRCGRLQAYRVVSRHLTSEGVMIYMRCVCGALRPRLVRFD